MQFYLAEVRKMLLSLDSHSLTGEEWIDKLDSLQVRKKLTSLSSNHSENLFKNIS